MAFILSKSIETSNAVSINALYIITAEVMTSVPYLDKGFMP